VPVDESTCLLDGGPWPPRGLIDAIRGGPGGAGLRRAVLPELRMGAAGAVDRCAPALQGGDNTAVTGGQLVPGRLPAPRLEASFAPKPGRRGGKRLATSTVRHGTRPDRDRFPLCRPAGAAGSGEWGPVPLGAALTAASRSTWAGAGGAHLRFGQILPAAAAAHWASAYASGGGTTARQAVRVPSCLLRGSEGRGRPTSSSRPRIPGGQPLPRARGPDRGRARRRRAGLGAPAPGPRRPGHALDDERQRWAARLAATLGRHSTTSRGCGAHRSARQRARERLSRGQEGRYRGVAAQDEAFEFRQHFSGTDGPYGAGPDSPRRLAATAAVDHHCHRCCAGRPHSAPFPA